MKLIQFIKSLLPTFERSRIFENLELIRDRLSGKLRDKYSAAAKEFPNKAVFKSDFGKHFQTQFEKSVNPRQRVTYVEYTSTILQNLLLDVKVLKDLVERHFDKTISQDGLSFVSGNILQVIDAANFTVDYAGRLLRATLSHEVNGELIARGGSDVSITPAELQWLDQYRNAFFQCLVLFSKKPAEIKTGLESVPDIIAPIGDYEMVEQMHGAHSIDPLAVGFISLQHNPIYRIRLQYAQYQVAQYRAAEAELEAIELRLIQLKYARSDKPDPALDKEVQDTSDRVSDLYFKLNEMREKLVA